MSCCPPDPIAVRDDETESWLSDLTAVGPRHAEALRRLHALLLRAARQEAARRSVGSPLAGVELADLAQQAADDALVAILAKLGEFRGESRFTTWAYKFVILEVAAKVTRHAWRTRPTVPGDEAWEQLPDRFGFGPEEAVQYRQLLAALHAGVDERLTPHQRQVFVAIVLDGVPLDVLADDLGTNRNALYKTLFDARRKLRAHLLANGYTEFA